MGWPKSLRWRYSLRALFVFITLFMVWGGYHANRGWKQRAAEAVLRRHGALIGYWDAGVPRGFRGYVVRSYQTLVYWLWGDAHIRYVTVESPLEPEVVDALVALPQIDLLGISPKRYTSQEQIRAHSTGDWGAKLSLPDGALERILKRHEIKEFGLGVLILGEEDCRAIGGCQSIESLVLIGCQFPEEGFAELLKLPRLRSLNISFCPVTGDNLGPVSGSTSLERIECDKTPVGNNFAAFVGRSPKVTYLSVTHLGTDNEFIGLLGPHPSLSHLGLSGKSISDEATVVLSKMPSLEHVGLMHGSLSEEAVARLKTANSKLSIYQP